MNTVLTKNRSILQTLFMHWNELDVSDKKNWSNHMTLRGTFKHCQKSAGEEPPQISNGQADGKSGPLCHVQRPGQMQEADEMSCSGVSGGQTAGRRCFCW